ncbi:MAG: extracellular solute-binding protein [Clostridiales bacterium]|nr:extracellular solute-binding protein [Clostridiales bacterium]
MKKRALAAVLCGMMVLTACGSSSSTSTATEAKATEAPAAASETAETEKAEETAAEQASGEKKQLVLSTFGLSEDISEEEVYTPFEEAFNCEIVTETGGTNDRYTKLAADSESTIDVIELSQAMTAKGFAEGLFEEIDLSRIENSQYMVAAAKSMAEAGQGVAYTINSIGIMYNPDYVDIEITDFDDIWDPSLEGMLSIPEITTTFGPAMVYMASNHAGVDVQSDNGEAAFAALAELKPNLVKTYTKSSDLVNMFTSGEVAIAVVGDFGVPIIQEANPNLIYVTPDKTYANFNTINITKNSKNKDLAYEYLNYRLSEELQTKTGTALNEAPTNSKVTFSEEEAKNMTYGDKAENAYVLDYTFVNGVLDSWIDTWNRTINN